MKLLDETVISKDWLIKHHAYRGERDWFLCRSAGRSEPPGTTGLVASRDWNWFAWLPMALSRWKCVRNCAVWWPGIGPLR